MVVTRVKIRQNVSPYNAKAVAPNSKVFHVTRIRSFYVGKVRQKSFLPFTLTNVKTIRPSVLSVLFRRYRTLGHCELSLFLPPYQPIFQVKQNMTEHLI